MVPHRKPLIAGNWKMNLGLDESEALASQIKSSLPETPHCDIALFVPFTALGAVRAVVSSTPIWLGAQNVFWEKSGPFTGEISAPQLRDAGCRAVLIGHSERRVVFGEKNADLRKKISAVLDSGLFPVLCVGETLQEHQSQKAREVIDSQIKETLSGFEREKLESLVIAYEPVWAIGTGQTATPGQAQGMHDFIRNRLAALFDNEFSLQRRIIYGGSVKTDNIDALMAEPDIDGVLVGGESLKADSFLRIINFIRKAIHA